MTQKAAGTICGGLTRSLRPPTGCGLTLGEQATILPVQYGEELSRRLLLKSGTHATIGAVAMEWALRNVATRPVFAVGLDMSCGPTPPEPGRDYTHADGSDTSATSLEKVCSRNIRTRCLRRNNVRVYALSLNACSVSLVSTTM